MFLAQSMNLALGILCESYVAIGKHVNPMVFGLLVGLCMLFEEHMAPIVIGMLVGLIFVWGQYTQRTRGEGGTRNGDGSSYTQ